MGSLETCYCKGQELAKNIDLNSFFWYLSGTSNRPEALLVIIQAYTLLPRPLPAAREHLNQSKAVSATMGLWTDDVSAAQMHSCGYETVKDLLGPFCDIVEAYVFAFLTGA